MTLITWTQEKFGTQIEQHDNEHKYLFNLLNALHQQVMAGLRPAIGKALDSLIEYVATHFASEERNMAAAGYADLQDHKHEHDKLVQLCVDLQSRFHAGEIEISEQTTEFLRDWLIDHIPRVDTCYAPALTARGIG